MRVVGFLAAVSLAWLAGVSLASAQGACPANARGLALNHSLEVTRQRNAQAIQSLADLAKACPKDGAVQYITSITLTEIVSYQPTMQDRVNMLQSAFVAYARYLQNQKDLREEVLSTPNFGMRPLSYSASFELSKQLINGLINTERATKLPIIKNALDAEPGYCPPSLNLQAAAYAVKDRPETPGVMMLIDFGIKCAKNVEGHAVRAHALSAIATRETDIVKKRALLADAMKSATTYLAAYKGFLYFDDADLRRLQAAIDEVAEEPPETLWFSAENTGKRATQRAIAKKLDTLWTGEITVDASKPYREAIAGMYSAAQKAPDPMAARLMLYNAAADHAEGRVRSEATKAHKTPPAFLYTWIKPPAATP